MYYHYRHQYYYPPIPYSSYYPQHRQPDYPAVDANLLYQSANVTKILMKDASTVLDKLSASKEFDAQLMYAAQVSDKEEVNRLINSIGVKSKVQVHFTPDGLRLEFTSQVEPLDCCRLFIALRWR
jgi:hypothetical protein